jgi:hypothetical protein
MMDDGDGDMKHGCWGHMKMSNMMGFLPPSTGDDDAVGVLRKQCSRDEGTERNGTLLFYISVRLFHTSFVFLSTGRWGAGSREQEEEEGGRHLPQDLFAANNDASSLCIAASLTYGRVDKGWRDRTKERLARHTDRERDRQDKTGEDKLQQRQHEGETTRAGKTTRQEREEGKPGWRRRVREMRIEK